MITYQEIYDILRKEKYDEVLQSLPRGFLKEVALYLAEKKEIVNREQKDKNLFSDTVKITRKQLDNSIVMIGEIIAIRQRKILTLAFAAALTGVSKKDTEYQLKHEKELFDIVLEKLEQNKQEIDGKLKGELEEEKDLKNLFIRFKEEVPAFLGANGSELGPFKQGDVANLPKQTAEILINTKKAILIIKE